MLLTPGVLSRATGANKVTLFAARGPHVFKVLFQAPPASIEDNLVAEAA